MASYQIRQRDPLLDQGTQAMLERRTRELFGLAIIALGLAFVAGSNHAHIHVHRGHIGAARVEHQ